MKPAIDLARIAHNGAAQRFELIREDQIAFCSYVFEGNRVVFDHTFVPDAWRGQGVAAALVRTALDQARRQHWKIVPRCSFVSAFIGKNPEYGDLVKLT